MTTMQSIEHLKSARLVYSRRLATKVSRAVPPNCPPRWLGRLAGFNAHPRPGQGRAMWLLVAREPLPDAPYWPGRHLITAVDAVLWPILWFLLITHAPASVGPVRPCVCAVALLCGLGRLHRALWVNHRYWFTTWRWGRIGAVCMLIGMVMKAMLVM